MHSASGQVETVLGLAALVVLAFHCGAMFFPSQVDALPGLHAPAESIRRLGVASQLAFALPALALIVVNRRAWPPLLVLLALSLAAAGVTMFWWFGLNVHLGAIAAAITATAVVTIVLARPPSLRSFRPAVV